MTSYNSEEYIKNSIESIQNQSYQNIEIIIIDDGSTDSSISIAREFQKYDSRIKIFQNNCNKGIPYTRNRGLELSKGKYMAILDSDDLAIPSRISRQVDYLEQNKNSVAVGSYYTFFGTKNKRKKEFTDNEELRASMLFVCPFANSTMTVRMSTIHENQISYNLDYFVAQDFEFWAQLIHFGEINIIPEFLVKYRWGHENITKKTVNRRSKDRLRLISAIKCNLLDYFGFSLTDNEKVVFNNFFIEPNLSTGLDEKYIKVYYNLFQINENEHIFNKTKFSRVISQYTATQVASRPVKLKNKLKFYFQLRKKMTYLSMIKGVGYIILKDLKG
jgi:glycosyltransferase involved in cell wall biosynthesis